MDLTGALLRAATRPRVLIVSMPGATRVRLAAERELRLRDLPVALTPADTDILLVTGPHRMALAPAVERLWRDVPAPRSRVRAAAASEVAGVIEAGSSELADVTAQRAAAARTVHPPGPVGGESSGAAHGGHGEHGDGGMLMPGGLPSAQPGADRDGLLLDRLHVSLGPVLADWPSGLTLRLTLQGDVVQQAEWEQRTLHGASDGELFWTDPWTRAAKGEDVSTGEAARRRAAAHLDSLSRFLEVSGWPSQAIAARRLRDDLLTGATPATVRRRAERLARQVGRSRTLHWLVRGIGHLSRADARAAGVTGPAAHADGDVSARYRYWLAAVLDDVGRLEDPTPLDPAGEEGPRGPFGGGPTPSLALMGVLPGLLAGAELSAARLIVASLDPDPDELLLRPAEVARG